MRKGNAMTKEDIEELHKGINILTFVRGGLNENESTERDLLNQSLIPLRVLILGHQEPHA